MEQRGTPPAEATAAESEKIHPLQTLVRKLWEVVEDDNRDWILRQLTVEEREALVATLTLSRREKQMMEVAELPMVKVDGVLRPITIEMLGDHQHTTHVLDALLPPHRLGRVYITLKGNEYTMIDLLAMSDDELLHLRNFGKKFLQLFRAASQPLLELLIDSEPAGNKPV